VQEVRSPFVRLLLERVLVSVLHAYLVSEHRMHIYIQVVDSVGQYRHTRHEANYRMIHWKSQSLIRSEKGSTSYHWIMKPSISDLLHTHRVAPLRVLEGVAPSGSVMVVGDIFVDEEYTY